MSFEKNRETSSQEQSKQITSEGGMSMMPPVLQLQASGSAQDPSGNFPYKGEITGTDLVAMRSTPQKDPNDPHKNTIADLPPGTKVTVIGQSGAWTKISWNKKTGYVSQELVIDSESLIQVPPSGYFTYDRNTPERITLNIEGVTLQQIAKDLYGDSKLTEALHLLNSKAKNTPETRLPKGSTLRIEYNFLKPDLQKAYDQTTNIIGREEWGAREPDKEDTSDFFEYDKPLEEIYTSIAIHHSGNSNKHSIEEVETLHRDEDDLADIGYHYAIGLDGKIYEGRPIEVRGSHVKLRNTGVIGIVLLADFDEDTYFDFNGNDSFSKKMESSMLQLIHSLQGKFPGIKYLGGHQDYNFDRKCPGNISMDKMGGWLSSTGLEKPDPNLKK